MYVFLYEIRRYTPTFYFGNFVYEYCYCFFVLFAVHFTADDKRNV